MKYYLGLAAALVMVSLPSAFAADDAKVRQIVDEAIKPVLAQYGIPGMAVAVTLDGKRTYIDYGVATKDTKAPVTRDTLFEIGSISKTFVATLTTYAEIDGKLKLDDKVSRHMPELKGSALDNVRLLDLATHTAGGFPLQLPGDVKTKTQLINYFRNWKPKAAPGTSRSYANPSIGLLAVIAGKAMGADYTAVVEKMIFPGLGLERTYVDVPKAELKSYAWGYNRDDKPVHYSAAVLAEGAYGVKSNSADMIHYVEVNMGLGATSEKMARAVKATHTGYFRSGEIIQDLIWEQYPYPVTLEKITAGNSSAMIFNANPAMAIEPPMSPRGDVIINKTGSTGGFGAYVAFVPDKKLGIVMLANKSYPNEARVKAAHQIFSKLAP
ncbi:MAG: class C beta-lactamase [Pseudolabrys sp.]|nr:class C beta-lactamase [Pseudolabrys sp.]